MPTSKQYKSPNSFSHELEAWLKGKQPKTLDTLIKTFGERSFAVIMVLFMLLPALPIPSAAHVLEAVVMIVAVEQIIGLQYLWLPQFLTSRVNLARPARSKTMGRVLKRLHWLESKSSRRGKWIFTLPLANRVIGLIVLALTLAAFFAPPFSMLDTLPAIGVVLIGMALLLDDAVLLLAGTSIGAAGVGVSALFGLQIAEFMRDKVFHK